jgi:hypothetical protein
MQLLLEVSLLLRNMDEDKITIYEREALWMGISSLWLQTIVTPQFQEANKNQIDVLSKMLEKTTKLEQLPGEG